MDYLFHELVSRSCNLINLEITHDLFDIMIAGDLLEVSHLRYIVMYLTYDHALHTMITYRVYLIR